MPYSETNNGSGYLDGVYPRVPLFGGSGRGIEAAVTITSGAVSHLSYVTLGTGYRIGDILDFSLTNIAGLAQGTGFRTKITSIPYTENINGWEDYQSMPERAIDGMAIFSALDPAGIYTLIARLLGSMSARFQYDAKFIEAQSSAVTAEVPAQATTTVGSPPYTYDVSTLKKIGHEYGYEINATDPVSRIRAGLLTSVSSTKRKGTSLGVTDRLRTMGYSGYATEIWGTPGANRIILAPSTSATDTTLPLLKFDPYSSTPGIRISKWSNSYPVSYTGGVITHANVCVVEVSGGRDAANHPSGIPDTDDYFEIYDGVTRWRFVYMPYVKTTDTFAYDTSKSGPCEYAAGSTTRTGYNIGGYPALTEAPVVTSYVYRDAASVYAYGVTYNRCLDVRGIPNCLIKDAADNQLYLPAGVVGYAWDSTNKVSIGFTIGSDGALVTVNSILNESGHASFACGQTIRIPVSIASNLSTGAGYVTTSGLLAGSFTNVALTGGSGTGALATVIISGGSVTSIVLTYLGYGYHVGETLTVPYTSIPGATGVTTQASITLVSKSGYFFTATITSPSASNLIAAPTYAGLSTAKAVAVPVWIDNSLPILNIPNLQNAISLWNASTGSNYVPGIGILLTIVSTDYGYQPPGASYGYQTINNRKILAPPRPPLTGAVDPMGIIVLNGGAGYTYRDPTTGLCYDTYRQYSYMHGGHGKALYGYITVTNGVVTAVNADPLAPGYEFRSGDILVPGAAISYDNLGTPIASSAMTVGTGLSCAIRGQASLETITSLTGGSGYQNSANGKIFELVSANGSGALAVFTISGGIVIAVSLTASRGQGYHYLDILTAPDLPGGTNFQCAVSGVTSGLGLGLVDGLTSESSARYAKKPSNGAETDPWFCRGAAANYVELPQSYSYDVPGIFLPLSQIVVHINHADGTYVDFTDPDDTGTYSLVGGPGADGNAPWHRINRELTTDVLPACIAIKYFATDFHLGKYSDKINSDGVRLNSPPDSFNTSESTDFRQALPSTDNTAYSYGLALGLW
jgi:hypothetical protein